MPEPNEQTNEQSSERTSAQSPGQSGAQTVTEPAPVPRRVATELGVPAQRVAAAVALLDDGATVPFVARYRKEATGGLDDAQLRTVQERVGYLRELDARRGVIVESIRSQGKLDDGLLAQVMAADTKARLEDIYLPYKPKRRTKAQIAMEAGLAPLADALLADPSRDPATVAVDYVDPEQKVDEANAALDGARAILVERFAEDADLIGSLRERMWQQGRLVSRVREGKEHDGAKFADYFDFGEAFTRMPSHRVLALFRGEKEEVLDVTLDPEPEDAADAADGTATASTQPGSYERRIAAWFGITLDRSPSARAGDRWLTDTVRMAWRTKILVRLSVDIRMRLRQAAEDEAVRVFAGNLRDLLLAAPAGTRPTMGLDPAYRTGVKVAVVDATGRVVDTAAVHPHQPQNRWQEALATLGRLVTAHDVELLAIGNGTASRETDKLAAELVAALPDRRLSRMTVSEAGASVYSASTYASRELPDMDVSLRGAVSIARRLQDPLAELVKIDPKSIGVGQYQHDLTESKLSRSLDAVVEDCVNAVGVDLNTASAPLLARVSGVGAGLAEQIVAHREAHGRFRSRQALTDVPRLGPKAFEQCAGFLRITGGDDPLDASAVHPEAYPVVRRISDRTGHGVADLVGNGALLQKLQPADFADGTFGLPTVTDILAELDKPGRDPRPAFRTARFAEGVEAVADLRPGMVLEGVVTNVAAFGAFVDVGVHQDGLVHVSAMSRSYVSDPRDVVKPGEVVTVKVLDVDVPRSRISLTLRLDDEATPQGGEQRGGHSGDRSAPKGQGKAQGGKPRGGKGQPGKGQPGKGQPGKGQGKGAPDTAVADALRRAGLTPD